MVRTASRLRDQNTTVRPRPAHLPAKRFAAAPPLLLGACSKASAVPSCGVVRDTDYVSEQLPPVLLGGGPHRLGADSLAHRL